MNQGIREVRGIESAQMRRNGVGPRGVLNQGIREVRGNESALRIGTETASKWRTVVKRERERERERVMRRHGRTHRPTDRHGEQLVLNRLGYVNQNARVAQ